MIVLLLKILLTVVPVVIAITFHETAHGYVAMLLGDTTAKERGRISLNPLRHIDRVGTILLPGFLIVSQLLTIGHIVFLFGWAKPVPVRAENFADPRRDMALVATAGPLMNFFLAWVGALLFWPAAYLTGVWLDLAKGSLDAFIVINLALGLFNLIPLPPLDGGRIAVGVLPLPLAILWARIERFGFMAVIFLVLILPMLSGSMGHRIDPVGQLAERVIPNAYNLVMRLAFHDPNSG
jgi:Zn-dependent protease